MKNLLLIITILLAGCASNKYGNFIKKNNDASEIIAIDTLAKLKDLYPPAKTSFTVNQQVSKQDKFGALLISGLHDNGYAVEEFKKNVTPTGMKLGYTLDEVDGIFRVTLYIGEKVISRAYVENAGMVVQGGDWSRKE